MRFIDLFAGLGGFHIALQRLGHECVFACEIDEGLQKIYEKNFGILPAGDIRSLSVYDIPSHDILCAGFPCQPFSKAGNQQGFECPRWGDLFEHVIRIIEHHRPTYLMLENVPNLKNHDDGKTWKAIKSALEEFGYVVDDQRLSPHRFGIPQIRERMFIVGSQVGLDSFSWPVQDSNANPSIQAILDQNPPEARKLPKQVTRSIEAWQEFVELYPSDEELPSFPVWAMEFGATYPFEDTTPYAMELGELRKYRGSFGTVLSNLSDDELFQALPSHARRKQERFPTWKINYIRHNRNLYQKHKRWIDEWLPEILQFPSSFQKFEWNCKGGSRNLWNYIIQTRASGVRVKRPTTSPSLVAMTTTQVPIIAWEKRYITPTECLRLQSMDRLDHIPPVQIQAIRALGNAVNVEVVFNVASALLSEVIPLTQE